MPTGLSLWEFILWHFGKLKTEVMPPETEEAPQTLVKLTPSNNDYSDLVYTLDDADTKDLP